MNARLRLAVATLIIADAVGACRRSEGTSDATTTTTATASTTATATATATSAGVRGCESFMQRGEAHLRVAAGGERSVPIAQGDVIPNGAVVELAEGAALTIRTSKYREISLTGAATAAVCPNGEDGILLSRGRMSAAPGTGVRPGVDVWVATPLGVVRYTDARIELEATTDGARLTAKTSSGQAEFLPAPGTHLDTGGKEAPAKPFAEVPVTAGAALVATRTPGPLPRIVAQLVHACEAESAAAGEALRAMSDRDAGELGERASRHVHARRRARAACETARAAVNLNPEALDDSLGTQLDAADEKRNQLTPLPARR